MPSRVAFVPGAPFSDLYGAINCSSIGVVDARNNNAEPSSTIAKESSSTSRLKLGPPLLEIRRMKCSLYLPNTHRDTREKEEDGTFNNPRDADGYQEQERNIMDQQSNRRSLFQHETILVSRGIPGLGGNVSSTCLDFRPLSSSEMQQQQSSNIQSPVKCATGLTSGALCIHTLSNLYGSYNNSNVENINASDDDAPSSTVAHYAPRQQRRATSVAWRPGGTTSNLVAVGLVGSGSSGGGGVGGTNNNPSNKGGGGGMSNSTVGGGIGSSKASTLAYMGSSYNSSMSSLVLGGSTSSSTIGGTIGGNSSHHHHHAGMVGLGNAAAALGGDRDFGTLVWDIEAQSSVVRSSGGAGSTVGGGNKKGSTSVGGVGKSGSTAVPIKAPLYRYARSSGVESLAWLSDGKILAVGCQKKNVQLYDLRIPGTNAPPISVFAHTEMVSGIVPDPNCPTKTVFATFGRNAGEPVKIWDARSMNTTMSEIIVPPQCGAGSGSTASGGGGVSAVAWSIARSGVLSIAVGDSIRNYDTRSPGSRALPVGVSYLDDADVDASGNAGGGGDDLFVQCLAFQPQFFAGGGQMDSTSSDSNTTTKVKKTDPFEFYPHRTLAVSSQGQIQAIPECHAAPLAVSKRDGRIATGLGGTVWIGPTTDGPSAMEGQSILTEDISARMMRRARCFHASRYSTDARDNVRMLEEEKGLILAQEHLHLSQKKKLQTSSSKEFIKVISNIDQLLHCWRWIALVEYLSIDQRSGENEIVYSEDITAWPAKGLIDAGVLKLLRMSSRDIPDESNNWMDTKSASDSLFCDVFDSPMRRAALNACGWIKKYGVLQDLLDECEGRGEFERSAALAVWHGDLNSCVAALTRGAEDVRALVEEEYDDGPSSAKSGVTRRSSANNNNCESYSETLSLIAMCVAGFNVTTASDGTMKTTNLWSSACDNLLRRPDISPVDSNSLQVQLSGVSYLRAILLFLQNIGSEAGFKKTIYNEGLSLADRAGFACRFLPRADLYSFLDTSMRKCIKFGHLEGLLITGLDKRGIGLLQSYMDRSSDVQTAALISCRVVLPMEWNFERRMCLEWLESYRLLLNGLQMWNSRAAFDVGRFEHLRRLKQGPSGRHLAAKKQHQKDKSQLNNNFPPQLHARCNYCNASLPLSKLRRQEGIANSWLSRQKPVLTCCPQCKKPLPRCSICLLSLGCLNPYMELQRERNQYPRSGMSGNGGGGNIQGMEDLSGLASIPFATWFSWCMRCKHGGHAHHLCGWFEKHDTCAVSGCDCRCQFDGIEKLSRPGLQ